jgi:hypothetical protein
MPASPVFPQGTGWLPRLPLPKPVVALVFCIVGGVFTIPLGVTYLLGGLACISSGPGPLLPGACQTLASVGAIELVGGIATADCGVAIARWPGRHTPLGVVAIIGAVCGLVGLRIVGGGSIPFVFGPFLGAVGGILAVIWRPKRVPNYYGAPEFSNRW